MKNTIAIILAISCALLVFVTGFFFYELGKTDGIEHAMTDSYCDTYIEDDTIVVAFTIDGNVWEHAGGRIF